MKPYKIASKWKMTGLVFDINLEDSAYSAFFNLPADEGENRTASPAKKRPDPESVPPPSEELAPSKLNLETTFGGLTTSERRKLNLFGSGREFIAKHPPDLTVRPSTKHACFALPHDHFSGYLCWNDLVPYSQNLFGSQEEMRDMMNAYVAGRAGIW